MIDNTASIQTSQISLAPHKIAMNVIQALYGHVGNWKSKIVVNATCDPSYKMIDFVTGGSILLENTGQH